MKKPLLLILALLTISVADAQQVSERQALTKAQQFFGKTSQSEVGKRMAPRKAPVLTLANNRDEFYVFNDEANGGYVVISGEERMPDVLAYSYDGFFDADNLPCNMQAWFDEYAEQVKYLRTHLEVKATKRTAPDRENVGPLLTCWFNQWDPYNDKCPLVDGRQCVTGCVATAMAQIMHYWQWPKQTTDIIPGYTTSSLKINMPAQPITTIDWDNIIDEYHNYNEKQADAVSSLMLLCGTSVEMDYTPGESAASTSRAAWAMFRYFDYDDLIESVSRDSKDYDEWEQLMYDELYGERPVLYSGFTKKSGHAFVLDGYKDGYFHANWGWGGIESWILMTDVEGWKGYTIRQHAFIGIQPAYPDNPSRYGVLDSGTMTLYYDREKTNRSGIVLRKDEWANYKEQIIKCVINSSFANLSQRSLGGFFSGLSQLESIEGIENLNTSFACDMSYMFSKCSSLTSLDVSRFKTENVTSMESMFSGCSGLTSLDVSCFKTDKVKDMRYMFDGCSNLTSLDVSGLKTNNVIYMGGMFSGCYGLTSLDMSSFKTDNVTDMGGMFSGCSGLTSLDVSSFKTDNVTDMGWMFSGCSGLTSLDVSGLKTNNVTYMGGMFSGCSGLTSLDVSGFKTDNVTTMGGLFYNCSSLTSLDVSGFKTDEVTDMGSMFFGCSSLTCLDVRGFKTGNVASMNCMFARCSGLTSLDVSGFKTDNVTDMGCMFYVCSGLTSLDMSSFKTDNVTNMDGMFAGCSSLKSLDVCGFKTDNVTNMRYMFGDCFGLTSLDLSSFKTRNVTSMESMFSGCSGLTSLDVSGFKVENVTSVWGMFSGCSGLTSLDISSFKTDNVTTMDFMFSGCCGLTSLDLSTFKTENVTSMESMFSGCSGLTSLDVSGFKTRNVTSMWCMFFGCSGLTSLDVSGFKTDEVTDMGSMFSGCSGLTSLDVSGFKTDNVMDMVGMFLGCEKLATIYASELWNMSNVENSDYMFYDCTNIVGCAGTVYDWNHTDGEFARIDEGPSNPGYLTYKVPANISTAQMMQGTRVIYTPNGKKLDKPQKGLNIVVMQDGTVKKVYIK